MVEDSVEAVRFAMEQMWTVLREQKRRLDQMEAEMARLKEDIVNRIDSQQLTANNPTPK
jgi:hypothetical protein